MLIFAPICEIPLAKALFGNLWDVPISSPWIQRAGVRQEMWRNSHCGPRHLGGRLVFLRVTEYMASQRERNLLCQRQETLCRHHSAPLVDLLTDVDLHRANIRA